MIRVLELRQMNKDDVREFLRYVHDLEGYAQARYYSPKWSDGVSRAMTALTRMTEG